MFLPNLFNYLKKRLANAWINSTSTPPMSPSMMPPLNDQLLFKFNSHLPHNNRPATQQATPNSPPTPSLITKFTPNRQPTTDNTVYTNEGYASPIPREVVEEFLKEGILARNPRNPRASVY